MKCTGRDTIIKHSQWHQEQELTDNDIHYTGYKRQPATLTTPKDQDRHKHEDIQKQGATEPSTIHQIILNR